ncbi:MAG: 4'-phosphopantetheinyl transferase superfamily protein [Bryobacteraceae bacterium]
MMWEPAPPELSLAGDEVHVWRAELERADVAGELDSDELARTARFLSETARRRFTAAHGVLRRILARYTGIAAAALRFERTEFGKPYLAGTPVHFNLAHSGVLALYAVARAEVGVDLEQVRPGVDVMGIARRFLPEPECLELRALEGEEQRQAFFRLWTRREAYLKARGIGIRGLGEPIAPGFFLADLEPGPGYLGAVACARTGGRVRAWQF